VKPPKAKSQSRRPWTDEEIAAYESTHAIGTKARLAFALGLYTGQRRTDVIGIATHPRRILGADAAEGAPVDIPLIPKLREIIDATPLTALPTFPVTKKGQPFGPTNSNAHFRKW
jgi:hypothetical protein